MMKLALALALVAGANARLFTMDQTKQKYMWEDYKVRGGEGGV